MNLQARKLSLIEWLTRVQDETTILKLEKFLKVIKKEEYSMESMTEKEYISMVEESESDIEAGRLYSHEEVKAYFKKKK